MKTIQIAKRRTNTKKKGESTYFQTDIQSICDKTTPKNPKQQTKRRLLQKRQSLINSFNKQIKRKPIYQRIYRFRMKYSRRTLRILQFREEDMGWNKKLSTLICEQELDNDVQSDSELIEHEVQKCKNLLLQEIKSRQQVQNNQNSSN